MNRLNAQGAPAGLGESFISSQWTIISSFWGKQFTAVQAAYEKAKAKLQAAIGEFLGLRYKLMQMGDRVVYLQRKADTTHNAAMRQTLNDLEQQRLELMDGQTSLEGKVKLIAGKMAAVEAGQVPPGGLGQDPVVTPTVVLAVAGAAAVVAGLVIVHTQKVNTLDKLLKSVENKTLTPAEAAALQRGTSLLPSLPQVAPYLIGAAVLVGGYFFFFRRR